MFISLRNVKLPAECYIDILWAGIQKEEECQPCLGGYYCLEGTSEPNLPCSAGYYCTSAAKTVSLLI